MNTIRKSWAYISIFITLSLIIHYGEYLVNEIIQNFGWDYMFTIFIVVLFFYSLGIGLYWSTWKSEDFEDKK